jgi:hypothetical protein
MTISDVETMTDLILLNWLKFSLGASKKHFRQLSESQRPFYTTIV